MPYEQFAPKTCFQQITFARHDSRPFSPAFPYMSGSVAAHHVGGASISHQLVESMGHPKLDIPWLAKFAIGTMPASQDLPSFEEVLTQFKAVHEYALTHLRSMTDAQLGEENVLGINFGGKTTKRFIAMHSIRHEGTHTGQLSLIAQFYGKRTI